MNELLDIRPRQWKLLTLPNQHRRRLLVAVAHLASHGPLIVLDCGRQFDSSVVARAAHGRPEVIDRISIQRAFICYEAVKLLEHVQAGTTPVLILDFLATFYDENVKMHTRRFLLESSLQHFHRLQGAGVMVTITPPPSCDDPLFQRLRSSAPQSYVYETPIPDPEQMNLF